MSMNLIGQRQLQLLVKNGFEGSTKKVTNYAKFFLWWNKMKQVFVPRHKVERFRT